MKLLRLKSKEFSKIYNRYLYRKKSLVEKVSRIIEDVRNFGDDAIIKYTKKFDKVRLSPKQLKISESEISSAFQNVSTDFINALKVAISNVTRFYKKQLRNSWRIRDPDGVVLGERIFPLENVGIYIPAGTQPYVSSVYMTVLPAKIAGVKRIVLCSPPDKSGNINPHILVVANLLEVKEIYRVGGAQAIAALAFGTKTIPKVDKIVGPGNAFVTEAKRQVFGYVDIDMLAGPTELVLIANRFTPPDLLVSDLLSQAEHYGSQIFLITTSKSLAKFIRDKIHFGYVILAKNLHQAADIANEIAPEHIQILIKNPFRILKRIKNAGSVYLGLYSPVSVGDYIAGPSHVLPTGGTARFFSGLSIKEFTRSMNIISYSKKALEKIKDPLEKIASIEGMSKHLDSVKVRF
jgi:histidinol dehydrogenase